MVEGFLDVSVVVPVLDMDSPDLLECLESLRG